MNTSKYLQRLLAIFCLFSFLFSSGYADMYDPCNPCETCCDPCSMEFGGFEVGADFIYWKPCFNNLEYAILFDSDPLSLGGAEAAGKYKYIKHDYEPGFRVRAALTDIWCGWEMSGSYTYFWASDAKSITPPDGSFLFPILEFQDLSQGNFTYAGGVDAKHTLQYQNFDVLFLHEYCFGNCHAFKPFLGIEGVALFQTFDSSSFNVNDETDILSAWWKSDVKAIGLKIGTEYRYFFCGGFEFFSTGSLSILAGSNDTSNKQIYESVSDNFDFTFITDDGICLPGCHIAAGFRYTKCWCDKEFAFRVGYEFLDWWNLPTPRRFTEIGSNFGITTSQLGSNIVLHGLFVGLDVGF